MRLGRATRSLPHAVGSVIMSRRVPVFAARAGFRMAIKTQCPHCERPFTLKDELAGKRVTCSGCRRVFPVPAVTPVPAGVPVAGPAHRRPDVDAPALSLLADAA